MEMDFGHSLYQESAHIGRKHLNFPQVMTAFFLIFPCRFSTQVNSRNYILIVKVQVHISTCPFTLPVEAFSLMMGSLDRGFKGRGFSCKLLFLFIPPFKSETHFDLKNKPFPPQFVRKFFFKKKGSEQRDLEDQLLQFKSFFYQIIHPDKP